MQNTKKENHDPSPYLPGKYVTVWGLVSTGKVVKNENKNLLKNVEPTPSQCIWRTDPDHEFLVLVNTTINLQRRQSFDLKPEQ